MNTAIVGAKLAGLAVFLGAALILCGCGRPLRVSDADLQVIGQSDLESLLSRSTEKKPTVLVDVRLPARYHQEHLPGAVNIPLADIGAGDSILERAAMIVVYGDSWDDLLSIAAGKKLLRLGYGEVRAYRGGLADWRVRNLPTVKAGASSEP